MGKHLQFDLADLQSAILNEGQLVEQMLAAATAALKQRHPDAVSRVLATETVINRSEVRIEERCIEFIALHQPVAGDLRRVTAMLRINSHLERMGDLALNLAERSESLAGLPEVTAPPLLETMGSHTAGMLRDALQAFDTANATLAGEVCGRDDEVDLMNEHVITTLVQSLNHDSELAEPYMHVFSASRIIERIADHATNIAEDVQFMVTGDIARHAQSRSA